MKRPTQKLIAFSTAVLSMLSFTATPVVSAEYKAEMIEKCEYDELIEMRNKGILIKNGNDYTVNDDTEIVVIDENGERKLISKEEGISGVYCYVSTTMGQYNFISITSNPYSFDFHDMSYRISTEGKSMIVGVGDKFAIMNDDGKVVSDTYNNIYRINDNYFNIDNAEDTSYDWQNGYAENKTGIVNADGDVIVPVTDGICGFFSCGEGFIANSEDGFYLLDSKGKKTSPVFSDVCTISGYEFRRIVNSTSKYAIDYNITDNIFRMNVDEDKYCLYNSNTGEFSTYYDDMSVIRVHEPTSTKFICCKKGSTYTLYDMNMNTVFKDADRIETIYNSTIWDEENHSQYIYDICVDKDGVTTIYDFELNEIMSIPIHEQSCYFNGGVLTIDGTDVNVWNNDYTESTHVDIPAVYEDYELSSISYETYSDSGADVELDVEYTNEYSATTSCLYKFVIDSSLTPHDVSDYKKINKIGMDSALLRKTYESSFEYVDYINNTEKPFVNDYSDIRYVYENSDWDNDTIISYYLMNDTSFIVCDTSLNPTTDVIEGTPETNYSNENIFSIVEKSEEETIYKCGVFTLTEGVTVPAEYDSLRKGYNGFLAEKDGNTSIISKNGELIKSLDGAYSFLSATRAPYDVNWNLYKREDGVLSTLIYNIDDKVVRYEQTGKYDNVSYFENDYAIVSIRNNSDDDYNDYYWSRSDDANGLIYIDGKEKIKPDKSLYLDFQKDKSDNLYLYMAVSLPYNDEEEVATSRFVLKLDDFNFEFAEENNMLFAFVNDAGNYLVVKDKLWGMYSPDGNALIEPSFCFVREPVNNLYIVKTPEEYHYKTYYTYSDGDRSSFEDHTMLKTGVIDVDGRIVVEPFTNLTEDGMEIEKFGVYTPHYIKTVTQDKYGTHICKSDVNGKPRYSTIKYSDISNDFALKYGYDVARKDGNFYYVEKNGLAGVVSDTNDILVPVEYRDILSFNPSASSFKDARSSLENELLKEEYSSKLNRCENGNIIVYVQNMDKKVGAYLITESDSVPYGDINDDNLIDASDASLVLAEYGNLSTDKESTFNDIQRKSADLNGDGIIDAIDASFILDYYSLMATGSKKTISEYIAEIRA